MARRRAGSAQALLEQIAAEVAGLPGPAMRAMAVVIAEAERELSRDLARWLRRVPNGDARFTAQQYRVALVQMRAAMRTIRGLNAALFDALHLSGQDAGELALGHLARQVERFSMLFEGSVRPMPFAPAAVLARGERMLVPLFRSSAKRYAANVQRDIQRELAIGVVRGETFHQLTNRLQRHGGPRGRVMVRGVDGERGAIAEHISEGLFRRYRGWAERIVRTESINAYNVHGENALREAVDEDEDYRKRWDASLDARLCLLCRGLDGKVAKVDKPFPGGYQHPPAHPNCFPAGTPILTARGQVPIESVVVGDLVWTHRMRWRPVVALSRQHTTRGLIALEWRGHILRATPNHPFATPSGWVDAEALCVPGAQAYVLQRIATVAEDAPAQRHEEAFLRDVLGELAARVVPVSSVDLDGDHEARDRDVDVELAHRHGRDGAHVREGSAECSFGGRVASTLAAPRPAFERLLRTPAAAHRGVGGFGLGESLCRAHAGVATGVVLGDGSDHTPGVQDALDGASTAAEATGERHGGLTRQVQGDDLIGGQGQWMRHARMVSVHPAATREAFSGSVYNFQVVEDESYVAGAFVVHNCRCALTPWHVAWGPSPVSGPELGIAPPRTARPPLPEATRRRAPTAPPPRRRAPAAPLPLGFKPSLLDDGPKTIVRGMPKPGAIDPSKLYAVNIRDLERAGLYEPRFVGSESGWDPLNAGEERAVEELRRHWASGGKVPPLHLEMDAEGRMFVEDGRHRIRAALDEGRDREMLVRFEPRSGDVRKGNVRIDRKAERRTKAEAARK